MHSGITWLICLCCTIPIMMNYGIYGLGKCKLIFKKIDVNVTQEDFDGLLNAFNKNENGSISFNSNYTDYNYNQLTCKSSVDKLIVLFRALIAI